MKFVFILSILLFIQTALAADTELSGNLEAQVRNSTNNSEAKKAPLFQDWDRENFYLIYGNIHGNIYELSRLYVSFSHHLQFNKKLIVFY